MSKFNLIRSVAYNKQLKTLIPGGVHYSFRMPWEAKQIHFVSGKGTRCKDMDGNWYLDFFGKFGANILGHNHTAYNQQLIDAITEISATNLGTSEYEVADAICKFVPSIEMIRFSLSGTEAVQNAIRLARAYTGKNKFVRFVGHYHGNADNIMGGRTIDPRNPIPLEFPGDFYGSDGTATGILSEQSYLLPWNDFYALEELMTNRHHYIAAIIMEPICINGGGIMALEGYLEAVRRYCDDLNIVLIFDEIVTGFRVGLSGAQGLLGIVPDLTTLGKAIAGGAFPVSAVGGKKDIMKLYEDRKVVHGGTFNGYPLGTAAVKATLEILSENGASCYQSMNEKMESIYMIFIQKASKYNFLFEMKGPMSCSQFHYITSGDINSPKEIFMKQYLNKLIAEAFTENGILLSNLNRFYSNICINDDDVQLFSDRVEAAFQTVAKFVEKMNPEK